MAYICKQCDKKYSSYKSLWFHNYKYHKKNTEEKIINQKEAQDTNCICDKCDKTFKNLDDIKNHLENDCRPSIKSNNIYTFKTDTLGKYKYKNFKGGDIYIVQTEFNLKGFYKIGISTDLYKRLGQYRCGNLLEPKLHYYYPCKNIKETDKLLKNKLQKFNIKREIYKADNIDELRNAIKEVQKASKSLELEIIPENKECDIISCNHCNLYFTNKQDLLLHQQTNHKLENEYNINNFFKEDRKFLMEQIGLLIKICNDQNELIKEFKGLTIELFKESNGPIKELIKKKLIELLKEEQPVPNIVL